MTKKRYQGLMRAYLTEVMTGHEFHGRAIKALRDADPIKRSEYDSGYKSYQDAWDSMMALIKPKTYRVCDQYMAKAR